MRKVCLTTSGRADYYLMSFLEEKMRGHFDTLFYRNFNHVPSGTMDSIDIVVVLGDRYEAVQNATEAIRAKKIVAHLHGGELTLGSMDEKFRHAITKLAHYHFAATKWAADRIISMGEHPDRVWHVGAIGCERIREHLIFKPEKKDQMIIIYHPNTVSGDTRKEINQLLDALDSFTRMNLIFFVPNTDPDYKIVTHAIENFAYSKRNCVLINDVGDDFINLLAESKVIVGNTSSGIIEAPSCLTPTVNVGNRQHAREHGPSIINCFAESKWIVKAINLALNTKHTYQNPYDMEGTSKTIIDVLKSCSLDFVKEFYEK